MRRTYVYVYPLSWGLSGFRHWRDWNEVMPSAWTVHIGPFIIVRLSKT